MSETERAPTALVTGAGSGLGAAIAHRLASDGFEVWVNDLDPGAADTVAGEIGGVGVPFDVTDPAAFDLAVDQMVDGAGRIDAVVNNAGILLDRPEVRQRAIEAQMAAMEGRDADPIRSLSTLGDDEWDRMMKTHVYGTFHGTRAALRHMEPARSGAIVNLASVYSYRANALSADYAAAKHAIMGFTKSVGAEVGPFGIRVNAVAPGFIDTPLLGPFEDFKPIILGNIASGRFGRPDEVAEVVSYLVSDRASYHFGDILPISGGYDI